MRIIAIIGVAILGLCLGQDVERAAFFPPGRGRIVGGQRAEYGQFPWQVSFREFIDIGPLHICGGSIISADWVVTAAHCCNLISFFYFIDAGGIDQYRNETYEQHRTVIEQIRHPSYDPDNFANDICLLHLAEPLVFSDYVKPIALPDPAFRVQENETLTVSGWGLTSEFAVFPPEFLQYVDVQVVGDELCQECYEQAPGGAPPIQDSMVCAGDVDDGEVDACSGDSGGPYAMKIDDVDTLIGIVSWGLGCARPGFPGVNTEVAFFTEWIKEQTGIP